MQGKTHRLGGILAGIATPVICNKLGMDFDMGNAFAFTVGSALGSLIPDIDHQGSLLGKKIKPVSTLVRHTCGHRGATHYLITLALYTLAMIMLSEGLSSILAKDDALNMAALFVGVLLSSSITFLLAILKRFVGRKVLNKNRIVLCGCLAFVLGCICTKLLPTFVDCQLQQVFIGSAVGYGSHLFLDCFTVSGLQLLKPFSNVKVRFGLVRTGSDWRNHKAGDTAEDIRKAKGFGEEFVSTLIIILIVIFTGLLFV